jgi:hypothetical protein
MSRHTLNALGLAWAFAISLALSVLHFQTYRNPERNTATRGLYRYWKRVVAVKTFGWRPFTEPEPAIHRQAWALLALALFLLVFGGASLL